MLSLLLLLPMQLLMLLLMTTMMLLLLLDAQERLIFWSTPFIACLAGSVFAFLNLTPRERNAERQQKRN